MNASMHKPRICFLLSSLLSATLAMDVLVAQGVVTVDANADFTLAPAGASPFNDPGNRLNSMNVTANGPSSFDALPENLLDGGLTDAFPADVWFSDGGNGNGATADIHEVTFDFAAPVSIKGVKFDWAWADRDDGVYEFLINGSTTSLGTFSVATAGGPFRLTRLRTFCSTASRTTSARSCCVLTKRD